MNGDECIRDAVIRGDGSEREGESRENQYHGGKDVSRAGGFMVLMGVWGDRGSRCFQAKHVKGIKNTLEDGLTSWDPSMLLEEVTNRWPDVNRQEHALWEKETKSCFEICARSSRKAY